MTGEGRDRLYRGSFTIKFNEGGDRVLGVRLATDRNGKDVIHVYEISYLDDIRVKELPIRGGTAIDFRTQGWDYKYWLTYTADKILVNIRGRETHTYDLDTLYKVRFVTGITAGYAAEIEGKVFYVSPQGGAVTAVLLWDAEEANKAWTGYGVAPNTNPRSLKPTHVAFLDESRGESNEFMVKGKKYKFVLVEKGWRLTESSVTGAEPPWDTVGSSHGGGMYEGPKVWAGVKIRSELPGAHVYGMDGSYWGETSKDQYVYRRLWIVSEGATSRE